MPEVSSEAAGKAGQRRWAAPVVYGVLGVELAVVIGFAATYDALDFRIYMWGGHAVLHDDRTRTVHGFFHERDRAAFLRGQRA